MRTYSFQNPAFLALLQGDYTPTPPPPLPPLDKTRFLAWLEAGDGQSTASQWVDQSGHGQHLTQPDADRQPALELDEHGVPHYLLYAQNRLKHGSWQVPCTTPAGDYTIYLIAHIGDNSNENYIFDASSHSLLLSPGPAVGLYYSRQFGVQGGGAVLPLGLHLLTWNLSAANGGRVFVDTQLLASGAYTPVPLSGGRLGQDYQDDYALWSGKVYGFGISQQADSAAQMQQVAAYAKARFKLSF